MNEPRTEYGQLYSDGEFKILLDTPEIEAIYPLGKRIEHIEKHKGTVYKRTIIVIEDWVAI